jgi:hypothetical protein
MNGILMALFFIAFGIGLRQYRKKKMSAAPRGNVRVVSEAV